MQNKTSQGRIQDVQGGAPISAEGASFLGDLRAYAPPDLEILNIRVSKMAISRTWRQISYSFNTNVLLVSLAFVKLKKRTPKGGGEGLGGTGPLNSTTASIKCSSILLSNANKLNRTTNNIFATICSGTDPNLYRSIVFQGPRSGGGGGGGYVLPPIFLIL